MNRKEFKEFLQKTITEQGTMSSSMLPKLAAELLNHIPFVLHTDEEHHTESEHGGLDYELKESQAEIDDMIEDISKTSTPNIIVWHKGIAYYITVINIVDKPALPQNFAVLGYANPGNIGGLPSYVMLSLSKKQGVSVLSVPN